MSNQWICVRVFAGDEEAVPPKDFSYPLNPKTSLSCTTFRSLIKF